MRWLRPLWPALAALSVFALCVPRAQAFSVRVHIHLANTIRDDLVRNWEMTGQPVIRLLGPDGREPRYVRLPLEDAQAIRDFPEYFRGGAIGPDNTVFPGLTDPSHGWAFAPFSQCQALVDNARTPEERAYALGCNLHGISDNTAHHLVNYFTGETFTLFPVDAAHDGTLQWSLLNVVRHMTVEGRFEDAAIAADPQAFRPERMRHRIATDLYRRVYLEPNDGGRGLWHWLAGRLVQRKNEALFAAHLDGFDPDSDLNMTIEDIRERGVAVDLDDRVITAYVEFLRTGGEIGGYRPGEITPADYIILLPEIVSDLRRLLWIAEQRGRAKMDETLQEWRDNGECSILCPRLRLRVRFQTYLFGPAEDGTASRFRRAVERKDQELDAIVAAYVASVERLSNLVVEKGFARMAPADLTFALEPLATALDQVTDFPYDILFPSWAVDIIDTFEGLKRLLQGVTQMLKDAVKEQVLGRVRQHLDALRMQLQALREAALDLIDTRIRTVLNDLRETVDEAKLRAIGIDPEGVQDLTNDFPRSVLWMNAYNSTAGALGNREVVFPTGPSSFFSSPVSFDASYQLEYNQLALCDELRPVFYPCGTSAGELLQPDYRRCQRLEGAGLPNPPVECHRFDAASFTDEPDPEACARRPIDEITAPEHGHVGSYTLAHPPEYNEEPPTCFGPTIRGINSADDRADRWDGDGPRSMSSASGCSASGAAGSGAPLALLLGIGVLVLLRRRR